MNKRAREWSEYFSIHCHLPAAAICDLFDEIERLTAEVGQYQSFVKDVADELDCECEHGDYGQRHGSTCLRCAAIDLVAVADTQGRAERPEVHRSGGLPDAPRLADDKQEPANCEWFEDDDGWHGTCGQWWEFTYDGPVENGLNYCMKCGKPVSVDKVRSEDGS